MMSEDRKKQVLKSIERYIMKADTTDENRNLLWKYYDALMAGQCGKIKSIETMRGALFVMKAFAEYTKKPLDKVVKDDIVGYISHLSKNHMKKITTTFYAIRIRQFYTWINNNETPEMVNWIKKTTSKKALDESSLITPSEIRKMIDICDNIRDKALISGLFESGCRISEWLGIQIKDVLFDKHGAKITVDGKTGMRAIRLIDSAPYLQQWIESHPYKNNKNHWLFINFASNYYGKQLFMSSAGNKLKMYAKRAGINKRLYPHILRHSRLTWLAQMEGFNERDLRIFAGWSSSSDMPDTYLHYGAEEVDRKLRRIRGLEDEKESELEQSDRTALEPKICYRCKNRFPEEPIRWKHPADSLYCTCGVVLDTKESIRIDEQKDKVNEFTQRLMQTPIEKDVDLSKGMMEAMYQTMKNNPSLLAEFKKILSSSDEVQNEK